MDYKSLTARAYEAAKQGYDRVAIAWVQEIVSIAVSFTEQDREGVDAKAAARSAAFVISQCSEETQKDQWDRMKAAQEAIRETWTPEQVHDFTFHDAAFDTFSRIQFYMMTGGEDTLELSADWVEENGEKVEL